MNSSSVGNNFGYGSGPLQMSHHSVVGRTFGANKYPTAPYDVTYCSSSGDGRGRKKKKRSTSLSNYAQQSQQQQHTLTSSTGPGNSTEMSSSSWYRNSNDDRNNGNTSVKNHSNVSFSFEKLDGTATKSAMKRNTSQNTSSTLRTSASSSASTELPDLVGSNQRFNHSQRASGAAAAPADGSFINGSTLISHRTRMGGQQQTREYGDDGDEDEDEEEEDDTSYRDSRRRRHSNSYSDNIGTVYERMGRTGRRRLTYDDAVNLATLTNHKSYNKTAREVGGREGRGYGGGGSGGGGGDPALLAAAKMGSSSSSFTGGMSSTLKGGSSSELRLPPINNPPPVATREQIIDQQIQKMQRTAKGNTLLERVGRPNDGYGKTMAKAGSRIDKNRHTYVWDDYSYEVAPVSRPQLFHLTDEYAKVCRPSDRREMLKEETQRKMAGKRNIIETMMLEPKHPYYGGSKITDMRVPVTRLSGPKGRDLTSVCEPPGFSGMGAYSGVEARRGKYMPFYTTFTTSSKGSPAGDSSHDKGGSGRVPGSPSNLNPLVNPPSGRSQQQETGMRKSGKRQKTWFQNISW